MRTKKLEDLKAEDEALEMKIWKVNQVLCGPMSAKYLLFTNLCFLLFSVNLEQLEQERDELHRTVNQKYQKLQHEGDERILLLENDLKTLTERLEEIDAQISSVISASNMDPAVLGGILEDVEVFVQVDHDSYILHLSFHLDFSNGITFVFQGKLDARNKAIKMLQMQKAF